MSCKLSDSRYNINMVMFKKSSPESPHPSGIYPSRLSYHEQQRRQALYEQRRRAHLPHAPSLTIGLLLSAGAMLPYGLLQLWLALSAQLGSSVLFATFFFAIIIVICYSLIYFYITRILNAYGVGSHAFLASYLFGLLIVAALIHQLALPVDQLMTLDATTLGLMLLAHLISVMLLSWLAIRRNRS